MWQGVIEQTQEIIGTSPRAIIKEKEAEAKHCGIYEPVYPPKNTLTGTAVHPYAQIPPRSGPGNLGMRRASRGLE